MNDIECVREIYERDSLPNVDIDSRMRFLERIPEIVIRRHAYIRFWNYGAAPGS